MRRHKTLSKEIVEYWPEIFGEVKFNVLPLQYLNAVLINFKNGKTWEVNITADVRNNGWEKFEESLSGLLKTYDHKIDNIDFKLDTAKVKKDITRSTKKFLNKRTS